MKYDEIKEEQLVSDKREQMAKLANEVLKSMVTYIKQSHDSSPLVRLYNFDLLHEQIAQIRDQTGAEAINYLRKEPFDGKTREKDGVSYHLERTCNYRHLAGKDANLNSLILSEKQTKAALERIQTRIDKRISEMLTQDAFKHAKPRGVTESITVRENAW